jgi:hypothetical protein
MGAALAAILEALGLATWMAAIRTALATMVAWIGVNMINAGVRMAISTAMLVGWAAFLAVVSTWTLKLGDGGGVLDNVFHNPLVGLPADMYALLCMVFPFGFFVRIMCAYVVWNMTFQLAAVTVMRGVKFLFGG